MRGIRPLLGFLAALCLAPEAVRAAPTAASAPAIATWPAAETVVVDGDTLRFPDRTVVRVLALDAEEVFHSGADREAAALDFEAYARGKRGDSALPVKFATPTGEEAKAFAKRLVRGARSVRLERDDPSEPDLDSFGRRLAHAVLVGEAGEVLLAEALIRAGLSPHFVKYGRSLRFADRCEAAQEEARAARRGIWSAEGLHYRDYEARLAWWRGRADQVDRWRAAPDSPERVRLGVPGSEERLVPRVGRDVVLFGEVRSRRDGAGAPWILWLRDRTDRDFPVVFFDEALYRGLDSQALASRYLTVRGRLSLYRGRPQVVVQRTGQVTTD